MTKALLAEVRRFSRFGFVGLATNLTLYLFFLLMLHLTVPPLMAVAICYILGVTMSYVLNRRWTFASNDSHLRDLAKFLVAYGLGFVSTLLTIKLLMLWLPPEPAQIINIGITAIVIYSLLRVLHFGSERVGHAH